MNVAITVGAYSLAPFVRLNLSQIRSIFGDVPVLVSDDRSPFTEEIEAVAMESGAAFCTSQFRRGHFAGWWQAIVSSLSFAIQEKVDLAVYVSQRFIPVTPEFRTFIEAPFQENAINVVVPSRSTAGPFKLPSSKWFSGLGVLTDCLVIRTNSITPQQLLESYQSAYKFGRFAADILPSVSIGRLLATFFKENAYLSSDLGNPKATAFLRRAQSESKAYQDLAAKWGIEKAEFDVRGFNEIEGRNYVARPVIS